MNQANYQLYGRPRSISLSQSNDLSYQQQQRESVLLEKCPTPDSELIRRRRQSKSAALSSSIKKSGKSKKAKQVTFSEFSTLCTYPLDKLYESNKSYKSSERKAFQRQAITDSERIQHLMASHPTQDSHTLNRLLEQKALEIEDFLGLEHLISDKGRSRLTKLRKRHSALLLQMQKELKKNHISDEYLLASVVVLKSKKSFMKARLRAALAA